VFLLELFWSLGLINLQSTELLRPPSERDGGNADLPGNFFETQSLVRLDLNRPKMLNDLLRLMTLSCHLASL
jgi:hypothetical protein